MATRIEEILTRARDTLADPNKERWDDARLLRLLDEGQRILATKARLLRGKADIPLGAGIKSYALPPSNNPSIAVLNSQGQVIYVTTNIVTYAIPDDIFQITRAVNHLGEPISFISHEQADKLFGSNWEVRTGPIVTHIIFDKTKRSTFRVYPIPDDTVPGETSQQIVTLNSLYGITVAGGLESTYDLIDSPYGVFVGLAQVTNTSFTLYYYRYPKPITSIMDSLEIHTEYDAALKFYICGMALRDDKDVQNRTLGNEELQLFNAQLTDAIGESSLDFSGPMANKYEVPYFGGF